MSTDTPTEQKSAGGPFPGSISTLIVVAVWVFLGSILTHAVLPSPLWEAVTIIVAVIIHRVLG